MVVGIGVWLKGAEKFSMGAADKFRVSLEGLKSRKGLWGPRWQVTISKAKQRQDTLVAAPRRAGMVTQKLMRGRRANSSGLS
jgi:hypothetical protein